MNIFRTRTDAVVTAIELISQAVAHNLAVTYEVVPLKDGWWKVQIKPLD